MTGCCKTVIQSLKVKDSQIAADAIDSPLKQFTDVHLYPAALVISKVVNDPLIVANPAHAPPLISTVSKSVLYCVYRI